MEWLQAIVLGIVQGLTEFLPISSSAHVSIVGQLFFDGRDPEQREAVGRLVAKGGQLKVKPILVAGSWLDLTKAWKTQVFYDQKGTLSKRFGITAVPAVIRQQGKMLVLDEIPAKELQ